MKILLTGNSDMETVIDLFNQGIIHKYLPKNSPHLDVDVNNAIVELQNIYFSKKSSFLLYNINVRNYCLLNLLDYCEILKAICEKEQIVEYYLIDATGSFLFLQKDATPLWLLVVNEWQLNEYYVLAKNRGASKEVFYHIKQGTKLLYFSTAEELFSTEGEQWEKYLFPAMKIERGATLYYSLIKGCDVLRLDLKNIYSYECYNHHH